MPATVALTGGSGFIGNRLLDRLATEGYRVRVLSHVTPIVRRGERHAIETVTGDLHDEAALRNLVEGAEAVVHCAGVVAAADPRRFHAVNALGTRALAGIAAEAGVPRFLLVSSLAAREPAISAYAASKRAAEAYLAELNSRLAWDVLRPPAVYGPGDRNILVLFRLLRRGLVLLPAGSEGRVSLIHVDDLVAAITAWLEGTTAEGRIYELDDGHEGGYSWRYIGAAVAREFSVRPRYVVPPRRLLGLIGRISEGWGQLRGRAPLLTNDKLRELQHGDWVCRDLRFGKATGWAPRIGLEDGLRSTLGWYRANNWL